MKRLVAAALGLLVVMAGVASAAANMKVSINGTAVTFNTPPQYVNNVLMVPLEDVASRLGIQGSVNLQTNTLELTDPKAQRIAALEARVRELEGQKSVPATDLLTELQSRYGTFKQGTRQFSVTWRKNPYSAADKPFYVAEVGSPDYAVYLTMRLAGVHEPILDWFDGAGRLIAGANQNASAVLVFRGSFNSYPSAHYSRVELGADGKWSVTDYLIWSFVTDGKAHTSWHDD